MLTVLLQSPSYNHQPFRSSPLSMRDPNVRSRSNPSFKTRMTISSIDTCKPAAFKCQSKYKSLLKNKDVDRDKRRDLFLKKVKQNGDNRNWEVRAEQMLKFDYITQRRRWEEEQARSASEMPATPEDEAVGFGTTPPDSAEGDPHKSEFIEQALSQEGREFEELLADLNDKAETQHETDKDMTDYGSDDDEYNLILIEAVTQAEAQSSSDLPNPPLRDYQDMDTEMG